MRILMMTNTYAPIVGGIERSIRDFSATLRRRGHQVLVVTPAQQRRPPRERGVLRVPALRSTYRGSAFAVALPLPPAILRSLLTFRPHVIHAHHPFLLGHTAMRLARMLGVPLVYTHHVRFEQYTHYLPLQSPATERFMVELSTTYANLCDRVFAPSESVAEILRRWGVDRPITAVPTGVDVARFAHGRGEVARKMFGIPRHAFLVGHIGRLAPEKNLTFLAHALAAFLREELSAHALVSGRGPCEADIRQIAHRAGVDDRLHMAGVLSRRQLVDAYHALDGFLFTSQSETQGIVLVEAMAAGVPVVALDASGVREVVSDRRNGRLLPASSSAAEIAQALRWLAALPAPQRRALTCQARDTARQFSLSACAKRALAAYRLTLDEAGAQTQDHPGTWAAALRRLRAEWALAKNVTRATRAALLPAASDSASTPGSGNGHRPDLQ